MTTSELLDTWIGQEVVAYTLRPGGAPTAAAPEGEAGPLAYPLGVGTNGGILTGHDDRGIILDSRNPRVPESQEELHVIPWSAIIDLKLLWQGGSPQ